jgi:hypothetical protein
MSFESRRSKTLNFNDGIVATLKELSLRRATKFFFLYTRLGRSNFRALLLLRSTSIIIFIL